MYLLSILVKDERGLEIADDDDRVTCSNDKHEKDPKKCSHTFVRVNSTGSWTGNVGNADEQWVQVDLGVTKLVTGMVTQGGENGSYVKKFKIQYSEDGNTWDFVKTDEGTVVVSWVTSGLKDFVTEATCFIFFFHNTSS